jgi:hypothetical protein
MTTAVRSFTIGIAAFLGGTACALFLSHKLESRAWDEFESLRDAPRLEATLDVRFLMANIEAAQRDDTQWLTRSNCIILRSKLRLLHPSAADTPGRRAEIGELMERARELTASLDSQDMCEPTRGGSVSASVKPPKGGQ